MEMIAMKKRRDSNLELYRIVVMLLIVCHHYVIHSGILPLCKDNYLSANSIFFHLLGMWGKIGINCFVMITGYYMCKSDISLRKFLKLLFEIEFYRITIYIIFAIVGKDAFSITNIAYTLFPFRNIGYLFVPAFMLFYLTIPYLNILIKNLTRKTHLYLLCLLLFTYTFLSSFPGCSVSFNYVTWFIVLYLTAAFIRLYPPSLSKQKFINTDFKLGLFSTVLCIIFSVTSVLITLFINERYNMDKNPFRYVMDSNVVMAFFTSVSSFYLAKSVKIPYNKFINLVGGSTFGVLLIHDGNSYMRHWLWKDSIQASDIFNSTHFIIYSLIIVISIFTLCIIVDRLRILFIERIFLYYMEKLRIK